MGGGAVLLGYTITNNALNKVTKLHRKQADLDFLYFQTFLWILFNFTIFVLLGFRDGQIQPAKTGREAAREAWWEANLSTSSS